MTSKVLKAGLVLAALTTPVLAHHGFYMEYETRKAYWIEGEVVKAYFGMPHADIAIRYERVPPSGDLGQAEPYRAALTEIPRLAGERVEVEFPQQEQFYSLEGMVTPGDRIAVIAYRGCDSPNPFRGQWIRLPSGEIRVAVGTVQAETERCPIAQRDDY